MESDQAVLWDRALQLQAIRSYSAAIPLWRRYLQLFGWHRSAGFNLAICEMHAGDTAIALDLMARVVDERVDGLSLFTRAGILRVTGQLEDAYREIHRAINLENSARIRVGLAEILRDLGRTEQAEREFRKAYQMAADPEEQAAAVAGLAPMVMAERRWDEAIELIQPVAEGWTGENHEAQFRLGQVHYLRWLESNGAPDDPLLETASRWFQMAQLGDPQDPRSWTGLGLVYLGQQKGEAARESLQRGLDLGDQATFVHLKLAEAALVTRDYESALEQALLATEGEYTSQEAWECAAIAAGHLDLGTTGQVIREAARELPDSSRVANAFGVLLAYEDDPAQAEHWIATYRRWDDDPVVLTNAVTFLLSFERFEEAREALLILEGHAPSVGMPSIQFDPNVREALLAEDFGVLKRLLDAGAHADPVPGAHDVSTLSVPLEDYYIQINAARFEERLAAQRARDWSVRVAIRPDYLEGKEIDVECRREGELELVEAKFRLNDAPVTRDEVVKLGRKLETARRRNPGVRVVATLSSNATVVDDDARQAAQQYDVRLEHCLVPRNWYRNPRWDITRVQEYA